MSTMAKQIFYLTLVLLGLMLGRIVSATEPMQMTMILKPHGEMTLKMAGTRTMTIDWGDRKARKTYTLVDYNEKDWNQKKPMYKFSHTYSKKSKSIHTIAITGGNITHLECGGLGIIILNVSKNTALVELHCWRNQLQILDLSNNTALAKLNCSNNLLSTIALNSLFETLHNDTFSKSIYILDNPGTDACNLDIATSKGWVVSHSIKGKEEIASKISTDEDEYKFYSITIVEDKPLFDGKDPDKEFREFVNNNIIYPPDAIKDGIEGKVFIQFSINQQGEVVDAEVLRGVHPLLDAEALRVINSSPKWTPGMQRGKPAKVTYSFPVEFILNKSQ